MKFHIAKVAFAGPWKTNVADMGQDMLVPVIDVGEGKLTKAEMKGTLKNMRCMDEWNRKRPISNGLKKSWSAQGF